MKLHLARRVRVDARYSFKLTYRWLRSCGYSRRDCFLRLLSDKTLCW